jgi:hypothetical protein
VAAPPGQATRGHAASPIGGRPCHVDMPPAPMAAGPATWTSILQRHHSILQRQHAGIGNGGRPLPALAQAARATCRLGQGCRHSEGVFFGKNFQRWSLLVIHWCRWSLLSKIRSDARATEQHPQTRTDNQNILFFSFGLRALFCTDVFAEKKYEFSGLNLSFSRVYGHGLEML